MTFAILTVMRFLELVLGVGKPPQSGDIYEPYLGNYEALPQYKRIVDASKEV